MTQPIFQTINYHIRTAAHAHCSKKTALAKYDILKPGGSLTLTSGTAALRPGKGASIGGALNGGVLALTKGLASELSDKRIRVNTVVPGLVKTELWDKLGQSKEQQQALFEKGTSLPVGFTATPDDIAEAYLYTARADYATGTLIVIGKLMRDVDIPRPLLTHPITRWRWSTLGPI